MNRHGSEERRSCSLNEGSDAAAENNPKREPGRGKAMTSDPAGSGDDDHDRIIVVSDLHLGMKCSERTVEDFSEFVAVLADAKKNQRTIRASCPAHPGDNNAEPASVEIDFPTRFILLGDIVDLWDPREQDRTNALRDLIKPFNRLRDLDCDVVYVAGNHDEDVTEFIDRDALYEQPEPETGGRYKMAKYTSLPWTKSHSLTLCARHFPEDGPDLTPPDKYLNTGGLKYYFVHGQQYDKEQVTYTLSRIFNRRFDPVDTLTDLANVSFTRSLSIGMHILLFVVWAVSLFAYLTGPGVLPGPFEGFTGLSLQYLLGLLFGLVIPVILLKQYEASIKVARDRKLTGLRSSLYSVIFLAIPLVVIFAIILPPIVLKYTGITTAVFLFGTALLTIYVIVCCIPRIVTSLMRKIYETVLKSRDLFIRDMIREGHFRPEEDTESCDVIVFGHTHVADCLYVLKGDPGRTPGFIQECFPRDCDREPIDKAVEKPKLLVNTGSWQYSGDRYTNTFAYIDKTGMSLLSYARGGTMTCLCRLTSAEIRQKLHGNTKGVP